jgi:hypothetical protein
VPVIKCGEARIHVGINSTRACGSERVPLILIRFLAI